MAASHGPKEAVIVTAILRALNALEGCRAHKVLGTLYGSGEPDIAGALWLPPLSNGLCVSQAFFFEVKRPGGDATPAQASVLRAWGATGALVGVVHSVEEVMALLAPYLAHRDHWRVPMPTEETTNSSALAPSPYSLGIR